MRLRGTGWDLGGKHKPHHWGTESHFKEMWALFCGHCKSFECFYARKIRWPDLCFDEMVLAAVWEILQSEARLGEGAVPSCYSNPGGSSCSLSQNYEWEINGEWLRKYLVWKIGSIGEWLEGRWEVKIRTSNENGGALIAIAVEDPLTADPPVLQLLESLPRNMAWKTSA